MPLNEDILEKGGLKHFRFLDAIAELPYVESIYLFGSRARGDHWEKSDIDMAIKYSDNQQLHRDVVAAIATEVKDTFLEVDLVDYNSNISQKFRNAIDEEKVTLYEAS